MESRDRIAYFCLLGILGLNHLVGHVAVEIAVGTQHRAGHRGAQFGIHAAHQHRLLAKRRGHPLAEAGLRLMVCIPNQQIHGERKTETRTAEQGSVRSSRKRVLHLFLHQVGMVAGLVVLVRYLGETRIELVALGHYGYTLLHILHHSCSVFLVFSRSVESAGATVLVSVVEEPERMSGRSSLNLKMSPSVWRVRLQVKPTPYCWV